MIDVQPYIDKLHLLKLYMENKIWCIGKQDFPYEFDWWAKEVTKKTDHNIDYWLGIRKEYYKSQTT